MDESDNNYGNKEELIAQFRHITSIISECDSLIEKVKEKDIVILLGNTKSGKSSLCHYIIGNELIAVKKGVRSRNFKIAAVNADQGPTIGDKAIAQTTLPTVWSPARISEVLVDAPGFEDNRGEAQDIANCFYIKKMITNAKSVKFMLICDIHDVLNDNINHFIAFIDKVYAMLPILENLRHGVCLVFTKDAEQLSAEYMRECLKEIYNESELNIKRSILQSFIGDDSNIAFFRAPRKGGPIDDNIGMDITKAIKTLKAIPCNSLPVITPAVSDRSRVFLLFAETQLSEDPLFFKIMEDIPKEFEEKIKVGVLRDRETAEGQKRDLLEMQDHVRKVKASVEEDQSLLNILDATKQLSSTHLREEIEKGDMKTTLQFIEFVNEVLRRPSNVIFGMHLDRVIDRIDVAIEESLTKVQEALKEVTWEEHETKVRKLHEDFAERQQEFVQKIARLQEQIVSMRQADKVRNPLLQECRIL